MSVVQAWKTDDHKTQMSTPDLPCCHSLPLPLRDLRMARYDRDLAHKSAPCGVRVDEVLFQTEKALEIYVTEYLKQIKRKTNKVHDMRQHFALCVEVAVIERTLCGKSVNDRPWFTWTADDMARHLAKAVADEKLEQARLRRLADEHYAGLTRRAKVEGEI